MEKLYIICTTDPDYNRIMSGSKEYLGGANFWYLHGKLQELLGYDKADFYEVLPAGCLCQVPGSDGELQDAIKIEGIWPIDVYGVSEPATGYFWIAPAGTRRVFPGDVHIPIWVQRGLVVLDSDEAGKAWAVEKYKAKAVFL